MPGTVLIVEDCESTATPLEITLSSMPDIQVLLLTSAPEALKILSGGHYQIAAVITDLHLPAMHGFELIEKIRMDARYRTLPIVVVSGDTNPSARAHALMKGANAYFPKPYSPVDLRHELERLLNVT